MTINQTDPSEDIEVEDRFDGYEVYEEYIGKRKAEGTVKQFKSAKLHFENFLNENEYAIGDIGRNESNEFFNYLKDQSIYEDTAAGYAKEILRFFRYLQDIGALEWNPISVEYHPNLFEDHDKTRKINIPLNQLRSGIKGFQSPIDYTQMFVALKSGARSGELYNMDLRDVNIDHPISRHTPSPRSEIADKPDTIFIDSEIKKGDVYNGEKRDASNKRERKTVIPIDNETKGVLAWYIGQLPPSRSPAEPLFRNLGCTNRSDGGSGTIGARRSPEIFRKHVTDWAKNHGWKNPDTDRVEGVTPHWCRHWFTTQLRSRIRPEEIKNDDISETVKMYVKGLRGDKGDDVIDMYTHDWNEKTWLRDAYVDNIPDLLI
jgi:integrase/recombinase XerC